MTTTYKKNLLSFLLGFAFLQQAVTSLVSGAVLFNPLLIEGDMTETMLNLAKYYDKVHVAIFMDVVTALGVILLGVSMHTVGKKVNGLLANLALSLYVFEAALLVMSKFFQYLLVEASLTYSMTNDQMLVTLGRLLSDAQTFSYQIHIIPFGIGAIIFYTLLLKAKVLPKWLTLWGLISVPFVLVGVILMTYGIEVPFILLLPYVPFEFVTGGWILTKGLKQEIE